MKSMKRSDGRKANELRSVKVTKNVAPAAGGSVLIKMGNTHVICAASVEESVPRWLREQSPDTGWITAEYSMLPYSTDRRSRRESTMGKVGGRTQEIQRLIGRSLRAVVNLEKLGTRTIWLDCDVLQADGGTRTASITGAYMALSMAVKSLIKRGMLEENPVEDNVAAISVGMVGKTPLLDLCYVEDVDAEVDMNVVMTGSGKFVEVQGTAEGYPYTQAQMNKMLALAKKGIGELCVLQDKVLKGKTRSGS